MKQLSAMLCEHANENPNVCRCPPNCYCQTHTCKDRAIGVNAQPVHGWRFGSNDKSKTWVRCPKAAFNCGHKIHGYSSDPYVMSAPRMSRQTPTKARFNFPLTIQQFMQEKRAQINAFEKEWYEAHNTDAKSFPLEMSFEDWEKEFLIHSQPEIPTNERKL